MKTLNEYIKESLLDDFDDLENELNTILAIKDTIGYKYDVEYVWDRNNCDAKRVGMIDKDKVKFLGLKYIKLNKSTKNPNEVYKFINTFKYKFEDTVESRKTIRKEKTPDPGVKMITNLLLNLPDNIFDGLGDRGHSVLDRERPDIKEIFDKIEACLSIPKDHSTIKVLLSTFNGERSLEIEVVAYKAAHFYKRFGLWLNPKK